MPATNTSICPTVRNVSKGVRLDMCDRVERGREREREVERGRERVGERFESCCCLSQPAPMRGNLCAAFKWISQRGNSYYPSPPRPPPLLRSVRLCHAPLGIHKLFKQTLSAETGAGFASDTFQSRCLSLINVWLCLLCAPCVSMPLSFPLSARFLLYSWKTFYVLAIMSKVFGYLSI